MNDLLGFGIADLTGPAVVVLIALLVITDKLVWHTRLDKAEKRAERWESIALRGLGVAEQLTVHAEVTNEVLANLPDPQGQREGT